MENQNAAVTDNSDMFFSPVTEIDIDSLRKRAEGRLSWSNFLGHTIGFALLGVGLFSEDWKLLVIFGVITLAEPRFFRSRKTTATLELIRRLEARVAELESRL